MEKTCIKCAARFSCILFLKNCKTVDQILEWYMNSAMQDGGLIDRNQEWEDMWQKMHDDLNEATGRHCSLFKKEIDK